MVVKCIKALTFSVSSMFLAPIWNLKLAPRARAYIPRNNAFFFSDLGHQRAGDLTQK